VKSAAVAMASWGEWWSALASTAAYVESQLFGLTPLPLTLELATAALALVDCGAGYVPALRVLRLPHTLVA